MGHGAWGMWHIYYLYACLESPFSTCNVQIIIKASDCPPSQALVVVATVAAVVAADDVVGVVGVVCVSSQLNDT